MNKKATDKLKRLLAPPDIEQLCKDHDARLDALDVYKREWRSQQAAIGLAAKSHRKAANLSLRETARRMDISAPYLSDLELGKRAWSANAAGKWMAVMRKHAENTEQGLT